ncbi:glycine betaine catabolism A [Thermostichus sp. OS-CIW-39]|jgi:Rieske 2Fe-2S family protein
MPDGIPALAWIAKPLEFNGSFSHLALLPRAMTAFYPATVQPGARTLPGHYYVSSSRFEAEIERIFYRQWFCVGRSADLAQPGDFLQVQVLRESLILVRDPKGQAHAFFNHCRHRGTRLCSELQGHFADGIPCPYHAWRYGLDGQLLAAPQMHEVEDFRREDYPLHSAALAEWEGFVWVNLSRNPQPFDEVFAPLQGRFREWNLSALRRGHRIEYHVQANWKLLFENYSECYHCPLIHPELARLSPARSGRNDLMEGPFLGGYMLLNPDVTSLNMSGQRSLPLISTVRGENQRRAYYYTLMPNLFLSLQPDYVMTHTLWPQGSDRTRVVCDWLFEPETLALDGFDPSEVVELWDRTNRQDWHLCELTQQGVGSRAYEAGPLSHAEGLLQAFGREYRRQMQELEEQSC